MIKNRGPLPPFLKILKSFYFQFLMKFCKNYIYINFSWKLEQNLKILQIQKKIVWKIVWMLKIWRKKLPIESPTLPLKFWNLHLLFELILVGALSPPPLLTPNPKVLWSSFIIRFRWNFVWIPLFITINIVAPQLAAVPLLLYIEQWIGNSAL